MLAEKTLGLLEEYVKTAEAELKEAKRMKRKPRVNYGFLKDIADVATKHSVGQKHEIAPLVDPTQLNADINRIYSETGGASIASLEP